MSRETAEEAKTLAARLEIAKRVIRSAQGVVQNVRRVLGTPDGVDLVKHARSLRIELDGLRTALEKAESGRPRGASETDGCVRYGLTEAGTSALEHRGRTETSEAGRPGEEGYRAPAKRRGAHDLRLEIDEDAMVSVGPDGAYVQAWVWVPDSVAMTPDEGKQNE
jgi:hypothetical protein